MSAPTIPIARDGEQLGSWTRSEIKKMVASGELKPTDVFFDHVDEVTLPLLPPPQQPTPVFDWKADDDHLWYYIQDGFMHGPRRAEEIEALHVTGFLRRDSLICFLGCEGWFTYEDVVPPAAPVAPAAPDVGGEHMRAGMEQLRSGNLLAAAVNLGLGAFLSSGPNRAEANEPPPGGDQASR
jgi:hypothetical protein